MLKPIKTARNSIFQDSLERSQSHDIIKNNLVNSEELFGIVKQGGFGQNDEVLSLIWALSPLGRFGACARVRMLNQWYLFLFINH